MTAMVTDFHSHILPGIDDGSHSVEESIAMLHASAQQGITHMVATPHFYARYESPEAFLEKRDRAEETLRRAMARYNDLPEVSVGAEVYFFRGMSESEFLPRLTIRGKNSILVEMPPSPWRDEYYRELEDIWGKWGITPIVAHVDRYIWPLRTYGIPGRLEQLPVLVQANSSFFLERATAGMAMRMLKKDQIQLLGSDCHNMSSRKPDLGEAVEQIRRKLGTDILENIRAYENQIFGVGEKAMPV